MAAPRYAEARGQMPSIEWIRIADLLIDSSYQRSIETRASARLIDPLALRRRRVNGSYPFVQHRTCAEWTTQEADAQ